MKQIHYFDLDGTLWQTSAKIWIIDKNNPNTYLYKIDAHTFNLIYKGFYINDNNRIYYNGIEGWLSNELLTKIKTKKPIELDRIGLSMREFNNINYILNQKKDIKFYIDRIKNLNLQNITLLTARGNYNGHIPLIEKLKKELSNINIKLDNSIFVNDINELKYKNTGDNSLKKLIKIIQSLIGFEIHDNKFVPIMCNEFDEVYFYDDEDKNIDICNEINSIILTYFNNSSSIVKQRILNKDFTNKKIITNLVTSNNINPFNTNIIGINTLSV